MAASSEVAEAGTSAMAAWRSSCWACVGLDVEPRVGSPLTSLVVPLQEVKAFLAVCYAFQSVSVSRTKSYSTQHSEV